MFRAYPKNHSYTEPDWVWQEQYKPFEKFGGIFMIVSPGKNMVSVADPDAITQITTRRNDFPKPIEVYTSVNLFGQNVVGSWLGVIPQHIQTLSMYQGPREAYGDITERSHPLHSPRRAMYWCSKSLYDKRKLCWLAGWAQAEMRRKP